MTYNLFAQTFYYEINIKYYWELFHIDKTQKLVNTMYSWADDYDPKN